MTGRTLLATLPGSAPSQRLEVALEQSGDGELTISLREQHYGEGIGWFDQRSLRLDPRQWRELQAVLGSREPAAQLRESADQTPATLAFPGPGSPRSGRTAAGGSA